MKKNYQEECLADVKPPIIFCQLKPTLNPKETQGEQEMPRNKDIYTIDKDKPMKIRGSDLKNAIYPLNIHKKDTKNPLVPSAEKTKKTVKFTVFGQHDTLCDTNGNEVENGFPVTEDDNKCMARIEHQNPPQYFIKVNSQGKPFNPVGPEEGQLNKDLKYKKQWEFKGVNKKVFNFYLNFLKTKNMSWLNNAGRELF